MILDDGKVKLIWIDDAPKLSEKSVENIVQEYLGMRKFCANGVPPDITIELMNLRESYEWTARKIL